MNAIVGSIVALVTPMHEDGSVDYPALRRLIDWHIAEGTNAIVSVGTTGESPTVTPEEHGELIRVAVETANGRVPVIAGTGGNSTSEAIELTEHARKVGADATLQVVPYYNKPTQEGLYRHFKTIAEAVDLPMILYNVPGRTVADMSNATVLRLAQVPGVIGLKDGELVFDGAGEEILHLGGGIQARLVRKIESVRLGQAGFVERLEVELRTGAGQRESRVEASEQGGTPGRLRIARPEAPDHGLLEEHRPHAQGHGDRAAGGRDVLLRRSPPRP